MKTTKEIKIKEVDQVVLDVPDNINVIAMHSSFFNAFYSEYYDGQKFIPIMAISSKRPAWEKLVLNIIARGGYMIKPGETRYVNYVRVTERGLNGLIILERTGETTNGIPVFKVSTKDPEAIMYGVRIRKYYEYHELQVNEIINAIAYETGFVSKDNMLYIGLIFPVDKEVVIDYTHLHRYRWVFKWDENAKDIKDREYRYEDFKTDEII